MSRIGKKTIAIPNGVKVEQSGNTVKVSGSKGALKLDCYPGIKIEIDSGSNQITVSNTKPDDRQLPFSYRNAIQL